MRERFVAMMAVALIVSSQSPAFAWNSTGHRVVALIAYKSLDNATKVKVAAVLKAHPAYDSLWQDRDVNSPNDAKANLFINAATFPDDARVPSNGFSHYNHRTNHYVNFKLDSDDHIGDAVGDGNLLLSFQQNLKLTKDANSPEDRAVALSWVFHQVGDAHQPLHAVARFSDAFPQGDEGGNLVKPFPDPRGKYKELHAYWDDLLGSDHGVNTFDELESIAGEIMNASPADNRDSKTLDILVWTKTEGAPIARDVVYGPLGSAIDDQTGFRRLPSGYESTAQSTARKRIALAGYRLAEQLKVLVSANGN
ncbi:MAG: S1/P1 nuclease [Isosphaeraceae bacterium]|nr:S1/P1 nuclease [Isosphaeraceae bacterium]